MALLNLTCEGHLQAVMVVHHGRDSIKSEPIKLVLVHPPASIGQQEPQSFPIACDKQLLHRAFTCRSAQYRITLDSQDMHCLHVTQHEQESVHIIAIVVGLTPFCYETRLCRGRQAVSCCGKNGQLGWSKLLWPDTASWAHFSNSLLPDEIAMARYSLKGTVSSMRQISNRLTQSSYIFTVTVTQGCLKSSHH